MAILTNAVRSQTPHEAAIYGTNGSIKIPQYFWQPDRIILCDNSSMQQEFAFNRIGNGYNYEAAEVMQCLREGKLESSILPLCTTIAVMETMDKVRQQLNLTYPQEE